MAASVNKVILIGHLGRDPEIKSFSSGDRCANLSIATSESWKDKATGERKERTEWHRVVIFNQSLVDVMEKYARKGSKLYIEGRLETRKWTDSSGAEKYVTEVVLRPYGGEIKLLDSRKGDGPPPNENVDPRAAGSRADTANATGRSGHATPEFDDEIPF